MKSKTFVQVWRWGLLITLIVLWEAGSRTGFIDPFFFSSPTQIFRTAVVKWQSGQLPGDIAYTASSTLLGFILGTITGSVLGLMFWFSRPIAMVAEPWLIVLNALPKLALAPVLVILTGIGFTSKVILAFLMTVVVAAMSAYGGVQTVDPALQTLLVSLGATRFQTFCRLVVPSAMPSIITGLRVNIALAMAGSIVGEFIASDRGLGRMIVYAGTIFDLPLVWVGVTVLSIVSVVMYAGVVLLERILLRAT
ncbi:MAG: ABC transporter permease [Clostridia bacterium]|nr:ABC transporter permease [Clostridia bacterium]